MHIHKLCIHIDITTHTHKHATYTQIYKIKLTTIIQVISSYCEDNSFLFKMFLL